MLLHERDAARIKQRSKGDKVDSPFSGNVRSLGSPPTAAEMLLEIVLGPFLDDGRLEIEAMRSVPPQAVENPLFSGERRPSCLRLASWASATLCSLAKPCCLSWDRWNIWARSWSRSSGEFTRSRRGRKAWDYGDVLIEPGQPGLVVEMSRAESVPRVAWIRGRRWGTACATDEQVSLRPERAVLGPEAARSLKKRTRRLTRVTDYPGKAGPKCPRPKPVQYFLLVRMDP